MATSRLRLIAGVAFHSRRVNRARRKISRSSMTGFLRDYAGVRRLHLDEAVDEQVELRALPEMVRHSLQLFRQIGIIAVEEGDQRSLGRANAFVASGVAAAVGLETNHPHPLVPEGFRDFHAAVGRAVVDDDQLPFGEALLDHAGNRPRQHIRSVVDRQDDRNGWVHAETNAGDCAAASPSALRCRSHQQLNIAIA